MPKDNLERMIKLADEFFGMRTDPSQLSVTPEVMTKLKEIHPATLSEETNGNGPVAWMLIIPTTEDVMEQFLREEISERELLEKTRPGETFEAIYLCSALVLPEYRGKGIARRLVRQAIVSIMEQHPVQHLFVWLFSAEGERLAGLVAGEFRLPLHKRTSGKKNAAARGT